MSGAGTLYVVGTPIGNLGDVTKRAAETLALVSRVVAEDTRRTRVLLSHLGITGKPLSALDANADDRAVAAVAQKLADGESIAFVTDAGMPSVSDPGGKLVRAAAASGAPVVVVPGPSAVTTAVAASGLVEGPFVFLGFLPRGGEKRQRALRRIASSVEPVVFFEAPSRAAETLAELAALAPERQACVARELTKLHEELVRGTLAELAARAITALGEFTIVVAGTDDLRDDLSAVDIDALVRTRLAAGESPRTVAADLAVITGMPKREIYARVLEIRRATSENDG
jgi:16S rRNA (cytidine1402-2'-O)-methyltransferase